MLEVRSGSGVRIIAVDEKTVRESMRHFVQGSDLDYGKVDEVRLVLEVAAAGLAAQRASAEDIAAIDETIVALENECSDLEKSVEHDLAFHRAIATATHNELFLVLHDSMGEMLIEVRRRNLSRGATNGGWWWPCTSASATASQRTTPMRRNRRCATTSGTCRRPGATRPASTVTPGVAPP